MQEKSDNYGLFSDRLKRLLKERAWTVSDFSREMDISRQTLYAIEAKEVPISKKTWNKLRAAEETVPRGPGRDVIIEPGREYDARPTTDKFAGYLAFIRGCREEAEKLSGGDAKKGLEIFEKLLATWIHSAEQ